jgi:hypothetical protein
MEEPTGPAKKFQGRVFNKPEEVQNQAPRTSPSYDDEIEGVLQVQRFLLLKLAEQENNVKQLTKDETNGGLDDMWELELCESTSVANLERFMADTSLAVQAVWNKGGKK